MGGKAKTSTRADRRLKANKHLAPYKNSKSAVKNSRKEKKKSSGFINLFAKYSI